MFFFSFHGQCGEKTPTHKHSSLFVWNWANNSKSLPSYSLAEHHEHHIFIQLFKCFVVCGHSRYREASLLPSSSLWITGLWMSLTPQPPCRTRCSTARLDVGVGILALQELLNIWWENQQGGMFFPYLISSIQDSARPKIFVLLPWYQPYVFISIGQKNKYVTFRWIWLVYFTSISSKATMLCWLGNIWPRF